MERLGFESVGSVFVYFVCFMCGLSQLMPVNAIFSAPSYILFFYRYANKDDNAFPNGPKYASFWGNVLTYYNFIGFIVCLIIEPLTLSPFFRGINPQYRMLAGLVILIIEIALFLIVPAVHADEAGCVATIVVGSVISGTGKAILESTVYGVFGGFPARYPAAVMVGAGISGALTSTLQVIIRGAVDGDARKQARIFYGLSVGIQGTTFVCVALLRWSSFAQRYAPCFCPNDARTLLPTSSPASDALRAELAREAPAVGVAQLHDDDDEVIRKKVQLLSDEPQAEREASEVRSMVAVVVAEETDRDGGVASTPKLPVFLALWPMFAACVFCFYITLMLFPTVVVNVDATDYWYPTLVVLVFNLMDVVGRFSPTFQSMWPKSHWVILATSLARVVFVPLLMVASYHYVNSQAYAYIMMIFFGFSNGYIGSMSMILGPLSRGVVTAEQRFIAGTMMGIAILIGGCSGSAFSIMIETIRQSKAQ